MFDLLTFNTDLGRCCNADFQMQVYIAMSCHSDALLGLDAFGSHRCVGYEKQRAPRWEFVTLAMLLPAKIYYF
jgi:hypothetical protein